MTQLDDVSAAERSELLRHLRHELRTPINHIVGYSELLLESAEELSGEARGVLVPDLHRIDSAGRELLSEVNQLLDPARGSSSIELAQACHALRVPLNAVIGYSELLLEEAGELVHSDVRADIEKIRAAGTQLMGMVGTLIELSGEESSGRAAPGPGTVSLGHLPSRELATGVGAVSLAGSLLVADDDALNREMLSRRLTRLGHAVTLAENGQEALDFLRQPGGTKFELVLSDIAMPGIDGYDLLRVMKTDDALREIPVIVLSASDDVESVARCIELGAEDSLGKPFEPRLLWARINAALERKQLRDREAAHLQTISRQAAELAEWNHTLEERVARQVEELEQTNRLRRFLSPQLADVIVSSGGDQLLQSHRREVAVLFCDLRGFTAFSAHNEPEEIMRVLGAYHLAMGELIFEFGGTLERFAGDGMMVFFNDPIPYDDYPARAVRMAGAMRERAAHLSIDWQKRGYDLALGIGIAQGYATVGKVGFEGRFDYAAIGPVTNLAARLCDAAAADQILINQRLYGIVEELVEVESIGTLDLKGFSAPMAAFNVVAVSM